MKLYLLIPSLFLATAGCCQSVKEVNVMDLAKIIRESKQPMIVNFWATFCVPCLEEMPYFQELAEKYKTKGVSIIFVSLDLKNYYPDSINRVAREHKIVEPVVWLNETNADYFCPKIDSSWSGGMPSSLFVNNASGYHKFYEQELSRETLEKEIQAMLKPR